MVGEVAREATAVVPGQREATLTGARRLGLVHILTLAHGRLVFVQKTRETRRPAPKTRATVARPQG